MCLRGTGGTNPGELFSAISSHCGELGLSSACFVVELHGGLPFISCASLTNILINLWNSLTFCQAFHFPCRDLTLLA